MSLLELSTSSYTPTLTALVQSLDGASERSVGVGKPLLVSVASSEVAGANDLQFVEREARVIQQVLPHCKLLDGANATADNVLSALTDSDSVHFSCHGFVNAADPSASGLILRDREVTVPEISNRSVGGRLAFLSACESALGSASNADEIVSLVGALQYSGWDSVIGTFAPVRDDIAAAAAVQFYELDDAAKARGSTMVEAEALRNVVRGLRVKYPAEPSLWSPFVHFGA